MCLSPLLSYLISLDLYATNGIIFMFKIMCSKIHDSYKPFQGSGYSGQEEESSLRQSAYASQDQTSIIHRVYSFLILD